jgi:hypothetical protein
MRDGRIEELQHGLPHLSECNDFNFSFMFSFCPKIYRSHVIISPEEMQGQGVGRFVTHLSQLR